MIPNVNLLSMLILILKYIILKNTKNYLSYMKSDNKDDIFI